MNAPFSIQVESHMMKTSKFTLRHNKYLKLTPSTLNCVHLDSKSSKKFEHILGHMLTFFIQIWTLQLLNEKWSVQFVFKNGRSAFYMKIGAFISSSKMKSCGHGHLAWELLYFVSCKVA